MPKNTLNKLEENTPKLSMNDALVEEYLENTSRKNLFSGEERLLPGEVKAFTGGVDFERVQETLESSNINIFHDDIQEKLGEKQAASDKWGNFAAQVGAEILGGTIEGIGYLGDVQGTAQMLDGDMSSFGNWISDIGTSIKEGSREEFPIFGAHDMSNMGFWLSNGVSVASSLSLMIPAVGSVRGLGALGKAAGIAAKMGKPTKAAMSVLGQAVASRHMENMMEASQNWEETRDFALSQGKTLSEANVVAADAASNLYKANYALLAQDIFQYGLLAKGPKINGEITSRRLAKALGQNPNKAIGNAAYGVGSDMVSEGVEEGLQFIFAEETKYAALRDAGLIDEKDAGDRLSSYAKNSEMWTSMLFGALGAGIMQGGGAALKKTDIPGIGGKAEREALEARIQHAKESTESASTAAMQLQSAIKEGNQAAIRQAESKMVFNLGYNAAKMGNFDLAIANVEDLIDSDTAEATKEGSDFDQDYKQRLGNVKEEMQVVADLYKKNEKKYTGSTVKGITELQYNNYSFNKQLKDLKSKESELLSSFPRYNDLSSQGQEIFQAQVEKIGLERAIRSQTITANNAKSESLRDQAEKRKSQFEEELKEVNSVIEKLETQNKETLEQSGEGVFPERNRKRIKKDEDILKGLNNNADGLAEHRSSYIHLETAINENNDALEAITSKKGQAAFEKKEEEILKRQQELANEKAKKEKEKKSEEKNTSEETSINSSRENASKVEDKESLENLADQEVVNQTNQQKTKKLSEMSEDELDDIDRKSSSPAVKEAINNEKIRRQQSAQGKEQKNIDTKVVEGSDIIEAISSAEPPSASNDELFELIDNVITDAGSTLVAETGHAIAWKSTTGMNAIELAENFDDIPMAKALTAFFEDPSIDKTKLRLEFYIDKKTLKESTDLKEGVEEELKSLYNKLRSNETLKKEEIGVLPVRAYILNEKGERIQNNGKDMTVAVHDTTFTKWEELSEQKKQQAINETIAIKEKVLSASIDGKKASSAIEEVRNGSLMTERDGIVFEKNNLTMATGMDPADMTIVMGDTAPKGKSSRYVTKQGEKIEIFDELEQYKSATPGAAYVVVKTANGSSFPLRTFVENLTTSEAELVYNLYSKTLEDSSTYKEPVGRHGDIIRQIQDSTDPRVSELEKITDLRKISIADLLKMLVYEGQQTSKSGKGALFTNKKGQVRIGVGSDGVTPLNMDKQTFLSSKGKAKFMEQLSEKRRQISISQLSNPNYVSYLVNNNILTVNATNEDGRMFAQPTTIFGEVETSVPAKEPVVTAEPTVNDPIYKITRISSIEEQRKAELAAFEKTIEPEYEEGDYIKVKTLAFKQLYQGKGGVTPIDNSDLETLQLLSNYPKFFEEVIKALDAKQKSLDAFDTEKTLVGKENLIPIYELESTINKATGRLNLTWSANHTEDIRNKKTLEIGDYTFQQLVDYKDRINAKYDEQLEALKGDTQSTQQSTDTAAVKQAEETVAKIKEDSETIFLDESEDFYQDEQGNFYDRVTTVANGKVSEEDKKKNLFITSTTIGTKVDDIVRDFFDGKIDETTEESALFKYGVGDVTMVEGFIKELKTLGSHFDKTGETVVSSGITLASKELSIAGTVDLLTYDRQGKFRIYDLKTMRGNQLETYYRNDPNTKYDSTRFGKSNRQKHIDQLSIYKKLLEEVYGAEVIDLGILPAETFYENAPEVFESEKLTFIKPDAKNSKDGVFIDVKYDPNVITRVMSENTTASKTETTTSANRDNIDYSESGELTIDLDALDNMSGTPANKQGSATTQAANDVAEMANTIDLDALDNMTGGPGATTGKYENVDFSEDTATKVRAADQQEGTITQEEIDSVANMVPENVSTEVIKDYITLLEGGQGVVGLFQAGLVQISNKAKSGDGYHEAFHAVFRTMLTPSEQRDLLDEARDMFSPLDSDIELLMSRHKISRSKAEDLFYEEQLADEFGVYALNPRAYEFNGNKGRKNFFERLMSWIKDILGVTGNMERIFKNIQQGKFNKAKNVETLIQAGVIKSINDKTGKPC